MSTQTENAKAIFLEAIEKLAPDQWSSYLDQKCGNNQELRHAVEELLQAHKEQDSLFDRTESIASMEPSSDMVGTTIGSYKLLQRLGEGGMGTVYLAERQYPIKQRVALKIIRHGMDSKQFVARFEAERQALALMDHPSIAKVLDAGCTEQGRPFFVMELVKGIPISLFCDENRLTTRQRLDLFVQVCRAIHHAHQKGIIHRDLKPSNVLVALYDDQPVPKVIDFGVAKATNQQLTDKTMFTEVGSILGTWEYMSPEQAVLNQLDVDTRSDVYSLGVLLYELLTGETPLERKRLQQVQILETLRMIREDEPPKPSTRVSSLGERATATAAYRGTDPQSLVAEIRGDLDWVVMKALAKERSRRYDSANRLAEDIEHYLKHELVEARPPSAVYRMCKFYRRNRAVALGAGAVFLALAVGIGLVIERNYELKATLSRLIDATTREAAIATLGGDVERGEDALQGLEAISGKKGDALLLKGMIALVKSEYDLAIQFANKSLNETSSIQGNEKLGAVALRFAAAYWSGKMEIAQPDQHQLQNASPGSEIDELLRAYALVCINPRQSLAVLRQQPRLERTSLGLFIRGQSRYILSADLGDRTLFSDSMLDLKVAHFLLNKSKSAVEWRALKLASAAGYARAEERIEDETQLLKELKPLFEELKSMFDNSWIPWEIAKALGDKEGAKQACRAQPTDRNMNFVACDCLENYDYPDATKCFSTYLAGKDASTVYARIAKAHVVRGTSGGENQVRELAEDLVSHSSPFVRLSALHVLCTACTIDEIIELGKKARSASKFSENLDDLWHEENCIALFADELTNEQLLSLANGHQITLANCHYTIGMKCLAQRNRPAALEHFEKAVATQAFGSNDFELARVYWIRMKHDPEWPHWLNEPHGKQ